jgi:hypothetical protein
MGKSSCVASVAVSSPSKMVATAIFAELERSLEPLLQELLVILGFNDFLACWSVYQGSRIAGRIFLPASQVTQVIAILEKLSLHCRRAGHDFLVESAIVDSRCTNHQGVFIPQNSQPTAQAVLYFGRDAEFVRGSEIAELHQKHQLVGQILGYPSCCTNFFLANESFNQDKTPLTITGKGVYPSILNPILAELYGLNLHFHFACSPCCVPSLHIARQHQQSLQPLAPSVAIIDQLGSGILLYGPKLGIGLITSYEVVAPDTYQLQEVITWSDKTASFLTSFASLPQLTLMAAHNFAINTQSFADPWHAAALFSASSEQIPLE